LETVAVRAAKKGAGVAVVGEEDVASAISEMTKIPVTKISQTEGQALLNLEEKIHERMVDQEEAVKMVADSLRRARAELRESKRPIASFLFMGPTGVGKTELAKTIAAVYFGREDYMIRIDMSEYQHPDSVKKMIGTPQNLGILTEAVRKTPFALILLDEFEKAHPDILNLFLQVMDDGRLTDGQGRTVDFTNCIIISTSNIGAAYIQAQIMSGKKIEEIKQTLINEKLNQSLRPELINRFDGIVVFKPLGLADVEKIAELILNKTKKMLEAKGVGLQVDRDGLKLLAEQGFDPKFGARPLRRLIQDKIENEIANKILAGEVNRRDMVVIDYEARVLIEKGRRL
jgi:ATP-dependent Clp protease ATP-binding subunit ClpC